MERIRNGDLDPRKVAEACHTPLVSLVEPKATRADMYPHTLEREIHQGEHRVV
jgi:hypothetical protein